MRLVSYNVLDGGLGRADPLAEIIQAQRPDLVALVEADNPDVLERIANRLGMDYLHARGRAHAAGLLSRWPILQSINHGAVRDEFENSMLQATVQTPAGELDVGVVHLHPHALEADEAKRQREVQELLAIFAAHRQAGRPHILCGDFNAASPQQRINLSRCTPRTRREAQQNGGTLPRRAIQMLLDAGYVDALAAADPAAGAEAGTYSTQYPGQRIDYIFAFSMGPVRQAWIERDRLAQYASDHYPVVAEIGDGQ